MAPAVAIRWSANERQLPPCSGRGRMISASGSSVTSPPSSVMFAASAANPNPVQPDSAIIAIKATIGLLPALAALIAMLIFIKYPLNDKVFAQIRDETEARKLAAIEAHHERPEDYLAPDHKLDDDTTSRP